MHMADSLLSPAVAGTMDVASGLMAGYSIHKLKKEENLNKKIPTMGVMGAFVFATQMVNFTIPGTGSSGHLCGGLLLTSILGPYAGFISMIGVLLIQALFFTDGGLLALGANGAGKTVLGESIESHKLEEKLTMSKLREILKIEGKNFSNRTDSISNGGER